MSADRPWQVVKTEDRLISDCKFICLTENSLRLHHLAVTQIISLGRLFCCERPETGYYRWRAIDLKIVHHNYRRVKNLADMDSAAGLSSIQGCQTFTLTASFRYVYKLCVIVGASEIPVNQRPECLKIFRTQIAEVNVISMFPHITSQNWRLTGR